MIREPLAEPASGADEKYIVSKHKRNDDGLYTVTFACGYEGLFSADEYIKYDLFAIEEANRRTLGELIRDVNASRCRSMALSAAKASPKPSASIRMKMISKGFSEDTVDAVIETLMEEGEINDRLFAERYAVRKREKGKSSKSLVVRELTSLGISRDIASDVCEELFCDDGSIARDIAEKKAKNGDSYEKVARYLLSRGFKQSLVMDILADVFGEQ